MPSKIVPVALLASLATTGAWAQQVPTSAPPSVEVGVPQVAATLPGTAQAPVDPTAYPPRVVNGVPRFYEFEFGVRFAESTGRNAFTLRSGATGTSAPVSRLSYQDEVATGAEVFGRVEHLQTGLFFKYYAGFGLSDGQGKLRDQDFEPLTTPYSSTVSREREGSLAYGAGDFGYHVLHQAVLDLGPFVGYQYFGEKNVGYGCTQIASNPDICSPGQITADMRAVGDSETWQGVRVGLEGRLRLPHGVTLVGEGAYLPFVVMNGADTHYQRLGYDFASSTPLRVTGDGYQVEGRLEYQLTSVLKVAVGARYTELNGDGKARLDQSIIPASGYPPQAIHYETERVVGFLQTGISF